MNQAFPSIKQDFSVVKIVASSAPIAAGGVSQIQLYLPAGVYHRQSRLIFNFSHHHAANTNQVRRLLVRNDCFPIRACTVVLDGQTCMQAAFLQQLQYAYWMKYLNKKNADCQTGVLQSGEVSFQPVAISADGVAAQTLPVTLSFTMSHFFAFLFDESSDYVLIKNQLSCTMTVDNQHMFFYQLAEDPKHSIITAPANQAGYPLQLTAYLRVPNFQVDQSLLPSKIHNILQYATNGTQSSIFSYTPQQNGLVTAIVLGFGDAVGEASFNSLTATNTPKTNLIANKTTLNGLSILSTDVTQSLDLANQMAVLSGNCANEPGSHAVVDCNFMGSNIQLQINPGANVQTLAGFIEMLPLM